MKEYTYRGYTFRPTRTNTEVIRNAGADHPYTVIRPVYEIDGLKEAGKRPFLTSAEQCREYIRDNTQ